MKPEITEAFRDHLRTQQINFNPDHMSEDGILIIGLQTSLPSECLTPDGWFLSLMGCVLSEHTQAIRAMAWREDNIRNVFKCLDHLYERVLRGYIDVSELQEIKDQTFSVTY